MTAAHTPHSPSPSAQLGKGPHSPLTVAPVDAVPPAPSAIAIRDQAQCESHRLLSILGSKATVTTRPGQLLCQLTRVYFREEPLGPTQC